MADFMVRNEGTIYLLQPLTPRATEWLSMHLPADRAMFGDGAVIEHRYITDIVAGIRIDGLTVATSWGVQVQADASGEWVGNGLRFATETEAQDYGTDLALRWTAVKAIRIVEILNVANYAWIDGQALPII